MAAIGIFSDSDGDLALFDQALKFLRDRGATRFLFAGNRFEDLDAWVTMKREEVKSKRDYTNDHFLEDVHNYLIGLGQVDRPPAFGLTWELSRAAEENAQLRDKVLRAPEKGSLPYQDPAVPRKGIDLIGDTLCCVVHDKNDLDKEDMLNAVILIHGKELEPKVVQIGPRFFITPGRLKGGKVPTVGLLEQNEKQVTFSAFSLDGQAIIDAQVLAVGAKTKLSVK